MPQGISEIGSCNMPTTNKERLEALMRRVLLRREKEDAKVRKTQESAKLVERMGK